MKKNYQIIVIGAGAGGLVVAIGAAKAGKNVLLIDKGTWGGDCTNYGCIPSKSLIAAAHAAHAAKNCEYLGLEINIESLKSEGALERTRNIIDEIRGHEDPPALERLGIKALTGTASFIDPHTLSVKLDDNSVKTVKGKSIVIATGSHPFIPKIKGLDKVPFLTNETIFDLTEVPKTLGVIGAGPIGAELAQAFHRLGSEVTIIQHGPHMLKKEEKEAQEVLESVFTNEGIQLKLGVETEDVREIDSKIHLKISNETLHFDSLLISTGRLPSISGLNLDTIGIKTTRSGIVVDRYGRTNHKHIFAVGDVAGHALFTHVAENEARTVLTNLLLPWPIRFQLDRKQPIPRVTYTDPEVASVGYSEKEAIIEYGKNKIAVYLVPFTEVDRAITTGRTEGFVKIVTKKWSSHILGATIVAPRAGEMLAQVTTAMRAKVPLRKLAALIHPYPTYSLAIRKAADKWLTQTVLPTFIGKK